MVIKFLVDNFKIERSRFPLFAPVFLGFGIVYGVFFPVESMPKIIAFCLGLVFLSRICKLWFIAIFALGFYVSQTGGVLKTSLLIDKQYLKSTIEKVEFYANVGFIEENHPMVKGMQRVLFKNVKFCGHFSDGSLDYINTIRMTCGSKMLKDISPLDSVKVSGSLVPFRRAAIPGSFDQHQYCSIMNIDAAGIAYYIRKSRTEIDHQFVDNISRARFSITRTTMDRIRGDAGSVAAALLTGDKSFIKQEIRDAFIKSGTAHILAIAGLHMSLIAGILYFIFKRLFLYAGCIFTKINAQSVSSALTIPLIFIYLALSGFSPSAIRAFIMTTICLISVIVGRRALSLRNIATAGFLILLFDPGALFHVSFQLSFSAVLALISFYEKFQSTVIKIDNKIILYVLMSCITTIIATISTTPISISTFNRFSAQNILGNLAVIPITSFFIAPLGVANIILGKFTDILIHPLRVPINIMVNIIKKIASLPGTDIVVKTPVFPTMACTLTGGILLCLMRTKLRYIGFFPIAFGVFHYVFIQKSPELMFVPGEKNVICKISEDGAFYANSKQKGKNKIRSIMNNLGFAGNPKYLEIDPLKYTYKKERGLFIYRDGTMKRMAIPKHPLCPSHFERAD